MKPPNSGPTTFDTIKTADTKARSVAAPVPVGEILVRTTTQSENMPEPPTPCSALKIMLQSHNQQNIICETDGSENYRVIILLENPQPMENAVKSVIAHISVKRHPMT